jgi:hypothetical protein
VTPPVVSLLNDVRHLQICKGFLVFALPDTECARKSEGKNTQQSNGGHRGVGEDGIGGCGSLLHLAAHNFDLANKRGRWDDTYLFSDLTW